MAFNLFKWFTTGNGDDDAPAPKPSPKASTPAPASRQAPQPRSNQWDQYVNQRSAPQVVRTQPRQQENPVDDAFSALNTAAGAGFKAIGDWLTSSPKGGVVKSALGIDQDEQDLANVGGNLVPLTGSELGNEAIKQAESKSKLPTDYSNFFGSNNLDNVRELTWEQYDALTPRQRAAVDANTTLIGAIRQDLQAGLTAKDNGDEGYTSAVEALFGKTGGSDTYAPATVAVLQSLGLSNTENGDLDQFLSGGGLVGEQDLKGLLDGAEPTSASTQRTAHAQRISNAVLDTLGTTAANDPTGGELEALFESLALRKNQQIFRDDPSALGEVIGSFLAQNPSVDQGTFSNYFEQRLRNFDYDRARGNAQASLGTGDPLLYIDPDELRSLIFSTGG